MRFAGMSLPWPRGHPRSHLNLGIVLATQGDAAGAEGAYEAVLAIDLCHAFGNHNFARLACCAAIWCVPTPWSRWRCKPIVFGRHEYAITALQAGLELQPGDAGSWFTWARC